MIPKIEIEDYLSDTNSVYKDVKETLKYALETRGKKVRMILIPHEVLMPIFEKIGQKLQCPFTATLFNIPVNFSKINEPQVLCVADDDTNLLQNYKKESEVLL